MGISEIIAKVKTRSPDSEIQGRKDQRQRNLTMSVHEGHGGGATEAADSLLACHGLTQALPMSERQAHVEPEGEVAIPLPQESPT
jgi:hypothetical protein